MKTTKLARLAGVALAATVASAVAVACSGDDNAGNPQPTTQDSGATVDGTTPPGDDASTGSDTSVVSDTAAADVPSLDTGSCKSDASTCNTCYTPAQASADPYNACSQYTTSCVPFDPSRVPTHPKI